MPEPLVEGQNLGMTGVPRRLILLRHAKSAWPDGVADVERPLAGRGKRDAPAVGRWLQHHIGGIDLVLCSPAARARQTWRLAAAELATTPRLRSAREVYGASAAELLAIAQALPADACTAVIIGHNPGLEDLVGLLTGTEQELKTSTMAVLAGPGAWADFAPGTCYLDELATPRG